MNKAMKILLSAAFAVTMSGAAMAHHICAYANDNIFTGGTGPINTVDGYKFGIGGPTVYLQPVATNGEGIGGGFFTSGLGALRVSGNDLYVDDAYTNDITHFVIRPSSCLLTRDNTLYPSGDTGDGSGDAMAAASGKFLYVGSTGDNNIYMLTIMARGGLSVSVSVATTPAAPTSIAVSADGQTLVAAYANNQQLCAYPINAINGTLGAPNCQNTAGFPADISIDPASACVYAGESNPGASEVVALPLVSGVLGTATDYILGPGLNSSAVLVSSDDSHLYISNQGSAQVTTANISTGCGLSYSAGQVVADGTATDSPGQLSQGGGLPFVVTGDYSSVGKPRMGLFRINGNTLAPYMPGVHRLTGVPNNAPFSVVAIVEE
jgi:hypothetical protein